MLSKDWLIQIIPLLAAAWAPAWPNPFKGVLALGRKVQMYLM